MKSKRQQNSAVRQMLEEAHSVEVLLDEITPLSTEMETYWEISLELIDVVGRMENFASSASPDPTDPRFAGLRADLNRIESRIMLLSTALDV